MTLDRPFVPSLRPLLLIGLNVLMASALLSIENSLPEGPIAQALLPVEAPVRAMERIPSLPDLQDGQLTWQPTHPFGAPRRRSGGGTR